MAPRSFDTDGAQGAFNSGDLANPTIGGGIGPDIVNDPGGGMGSVPSGDGLTSLTSTGNSWGADGGMGSAPGGGGTTSLSSTGNSWGGSGSNSSPDGSLLSSVGGGMFGGMGSGGGVGLDGSRGYHSPLHGQPIYQNTGGMNRVAFDDGGSMPDDTTSTGNDLVGLALATVDSALQYGRQKYGLSNGDEESGGATQTAGAMPMIPGSQSETPGPYKPQPQQPAPQQQAGAMPMIPGSQSETPGPYTPQQPKPQQVAAAMPMIPGSQSNTPGPYVPQQPQPQPQAGAIPDDQEEAA